MESAGLNLLKSSRSGRSSGGTTTTRMGRKWHAFSESFLDREYKNSGEETLLLNGCASRTLVFRRLYIRDKQMDIGFKNYDKHYIRTGNHEPDWDSAEMCPARYACAKPWLPKDRQAKILDFGCGWGHQLLGLWCAGYKDIEGVELVPEQAATAVRCAGDRAAITCMDGREFLAEKKNLYDLIILNDVLEHIPTGEAVPLLQLIREALRPGGTVALRVPNMANVVAPYSRYLDITHVAGYTEFSLMQLLDLAGFDGHHVVPEDLSLRSWRPWIPWRGLKLTTRLNILGHEILYWLRHTNPCPTVFGTNVEVYSCKPDNTSRNNGCHE